MNHFLIYLWAISDNIKMLFFSSFIISLLIFIPCVLKFNEYDKFMGINKKCLIYGIIPLFFLIGVTLIPSKQDLALLIVYPKIQNSQQVQKLSKVSNLYLDKMIKELKKGE